MSRKTIIKAYVIERKRVIGAYLFFVAIFLVVFKLYSIKLRIVLYPALLCGVFAVLFSVKDFLRYTKAHLYREQLKKHIDVTLDNLPKASSLSERDYQVLLKRLMEEKNKELAYRNKQYTDLREYITLWSHQIKTPITALGLMLQAEAASSELKDRLLEIEQYVDITLQYTRLDSLNSDLVLKEYSLDDIVRSAVKYYSRTFIAKRLSLDLSPLDTRVVTDEKWLLFVIKQVLSNALKYTKEGRISIYMAKGEGKTLVIKDTGIGISSEDIPRIFERGFTGYNGRRNKKSTGIGLYLSKEIIDKLGHKMIITSELGKGTMVELHLS